MSFHKEREIEAEAKRLEAESKRLDSEASRLVAAKEYAVATKDIPMESLVPPPTPEEAKDARAFSFNSRFLTLSFALLFTGITYIFVAYMVGTYGARTTRMDGEPARRPAMVKIMSPVTLDKALKEKPGG